MDETISGSQRLFCCLATKNGLLSLQLRVEWSKMKQDSTEKLTSGMIKKKKSTLTAGEVLCCKMSCNQITLKGCECLCFFAAASLTVISVKAVSGMITESIKGQLQLIYPIFYIMLVVMIASCAFQIKLVKVFSFLRPSVCLLFQALSVSSFCFNPLRSPQARFNFGRPCP